ncbi:helix-turn-helix domain-containing protein [[Mycobacterium] kokjensenii]|uniref:Helix-turn-helix domain-containing protein n=1 Tax=[Mycobacterium] kokjensenii TaxID=3064287 RepID=A0ABM9LT22_9MYCO|nr:helix-turn-helix domain-containing protein [Mycolicibacter sp. MU0083]CAJ1504264.1 helix-turn-helix domain-containing protein [Mycolicibacter sp. MU0083]
MDWSQRIAQHITPNGSVIVPPRIARWLETQAGMTADRRIALRMTDPEAYEVLAALHLVALSTRSATGTEPATPQHDSQESNQWVTTTEAATKLGVTDRAIRKWCATGRLPATNCGGRWLINTTHLNTHKLTA